MTELNLLTLNLLNVSSIVPFMYIFLRPDCSVSQEEITSFRFVNQMPVLDFTEGN